MTSSNFIVCSGFINITVRSLIVYILKAGLSSFMFISGWVWTSVRSYLANGLLVSSVQYFTAFLINWASSHCTYVYASAADMKKFLKLEEHASNLFNFEGSVNICTSGVL